MSPLFLRFFSLERDPAAWRTFVPLGTKCHSEHCNLGNTTKCGPCYVVSFCMTLGKNLTSLDACSSICIKAKRYSNYQDIKMHV